MAVLPKRLLQLISLLESHQCVSHKTPFCKHEKGCVINTVRGAIRGFLYGYGIKSSVSLILALAFGKAFRKPRVIMEALGFSSLRFGAFLGLFNALYSTVLCSMRRIRNKEDGLNAFVAGGVAGSSLLVDAANQRKTLALYLSSRALEAVFNSGVSRSYWSSYKYGAVVLFCSLCSIVVYGYTFEPEILDGSYRRFLTSASSLKPNDLIAFGIWQEQYQKAHGFKVNPVDPLVHSLHRKAATKH
eukprot:GILJ01002243.1.p1 GENE.GILJ01002243.1~~GILJ01002243.1.p1  ORF type:complete len:244 (-),score=25.35 GILJ01002243.1:78-809(-)